MINSIIKKMLVLWGLVGMVACQKDGNDIEVWMAQDIESEWGLATVEIRLAPDASFEAWIKFSDGEIKQTGVYSRNEASGRLTLNYQHGGDPIIFELVDEILVGTEGDQVVILKRKEK